MWPSPQEYAELVTFAEEILNEKLHFLCSVYFLKPTFLKHVMHLLLKSFLVTLSKYLPGGYNN